MALTAEAEYRQTAPPLMAGAAPPGEPIGRPGPLTAIERFQFESAGYLLVPGAISADQAAVCLAACERLHADTPVGAWRQIPLAYQREPAIADLIDHPAVLAKVRALLGDFLKVQSSWCTRVPPRSGEMAYHQDGYAPSPFRELAPATPLVQLRVGWVMTPLSGSDCGNLAFIPGSHRCPVSLPPGTVVGDVPSARLITAEPGTAVLFHQGIWHTSTLNLRDRPRFMQHIVYAPPWLVRRHAHDPAFIAAQPPLRRALLEDWTAAAKNFNEAERPPWESASIVC
ncbi:hypothetical protein LBMAG53_33600 [Planctomycetota bacterium]|nr:hypothetical protein LBMAG53_33600 [Planctomycetota bacterium]